MNQRKSDKGTKTTTLRFDSILYATIQALAAERGCSLSAIVHEAVRAHTKPAGKGFVDRVDAMVRSGRRPYVTVLTSVERPHVYHGRIDEERWAEYRAYGKLPLLLTFEEFSLRAIAGDYHDEIEKMVLPTEVALDLVTSIVEDPGARLCNEYCAGLNGGLNENTRACAGASLMLEERYEKSLLASLEEAADEVDVYERLAKAAAEHPERMARLDSPRWHAVSPRLKENLERALDSFKKGGPIRPALFDVRLVGGMTNTVVLWLSLSDYGARFTTHRGLGDPVIRRMFEKAIAEPNGFLSVFGEWRAELTAREIYAANGGARY